MKLVKAFNIMSLQNYIKNTGSTQTIIKDSYNRPVFNNINWEADYNGNIANINVDINDNGDDYQIKAKNPFFRFTKISH